MKIRSEGDWKKKIDPHFDKLVIYFLEFIGQLERHPTEGFLSLPEDFAQGVTENKWQDFYKGEFKGDFFSLLDKLGFDRGAQVNVLETFKAFDNPEKLLGLCSKLIDSLPEEESRRYYRRELEALAGKPDFRPDMENLYDRETRDFCSIIFSLLPRYLIAELEKSISSFTPSDSEIEGELRKPDTLMTIVGVLLFMFPYIAHQKTVNELIAKFSEGDDKSLFKAVTFDKSFLFNENVKERIIKAQLTGDSRFFKDLGKAIADSPLKRIGQHSKTYFVLSFFWLIGLYKLNLDELHSFLESCGIIPPVHPYAFEKFIQRYIKPIYKF